jgi:hypothetical protein
MHSHTRFDTQEWFVFLLQDEKYIYRNKENKEIVDLKEIFNNFKKLDQKFRFFNKMPRILNVD